MLVTGNQQIRLQENFSQDFRDLNSATNEPSACAELTALTASIYAAYLNGRHIFSGTFLGGFIISNLLQPSNQSFQRSMNNKTLPLVFDDLDPIKTPCFNVPPYF